MSRFETKRRSKSSAVGMATATLDTEFCGQRLSAPCAVNEPRRRWNGHGRPTTGAASPGNVVLFYVLGNRVSLRGLPGGAEGNRTSSFLMMRSRKLALR